MNKQPGIYQIFNLQNGKSYIGSSKNVSNRCVIHRSQLRKGIHGNQHLQHAWNKYGESSFEFRLVQNLPLDKNLLQTAEQYWSDYFQEHSYNIRKIVQTNLGIKYSQEARAKMSAWQIGRKMSEEAKKKMSLAKIGKVYWAKGRKHTQTTKTKISQVQFKPIESICPKTGLVTQYSSGLQAVATGLYTSTGISDCLNGRIKKHRKLYWNYLGDINGNNS